MRRRQRGDVDPSSSIEQCAFCGVHRKELRRLVAGPAVAICDTCVGLCVGILRADDSMPPYRLLEADIALLEVEGRVACPHCELELGHRARHRKAPLVVGTPLAHAVIGAGVEPGQYVVFGRSHLAAGAGCPPDEAAEVHALAGRLARAGVRAFGNRYVVVEDVPAVDDTFRHFQLRVVRTEAIAPAPASPSDDPELDERLSALAANFERYRLE